MRHGRQAAFLAMTTAAGQAVLAAATIFMARVSAPEDFGLAMTAVAISLGLTAFLDFGTTAYSVRQYAAGFWDSAHVGRVLSGKVAVVLSGALPGFLFLWWFDAGEIYWLVPLIAVVTVVAQACRVPLQAAARAHLVGAVLFLDRVVVAGATGALWLIGLEPATALCAGFAVGPLAGAWLAVVLTPRNWRVTLDWHIENPWRGAANFGTFGMAIAAQGLDLPVLSVAAGSAEAGIYAAVQRWVTPMNLLTNSVANSAVPFLAAARTNRDARRFMRRTAPLIGVGVLGSVAVVIFADEMTAAALGSEYADSARVLQLLAVATILVGIGQPLATVLMSRGRDRVVARITCSVVVGQFALLLILAPRFGAAAASLALVAAQATLVLSYALAIRTLVDE